MDPEKYFARLIVMCLLEQAYFVLNSTRGTVLET